MAQQNRKQKCKGCKDGGIYQNLYVGYWFSSPKQKPQFSQNRFIWYKTVLSLQTLLFYWSFLQQKYLISNETSKIVDLTCKIMRKFLFPMYSGFYLHL